MLKIGLTGGIGSGKSTVAKVFEVLGIPVYYADEAARRLMNENKSLIQQLIAVFGNETYSSGKLNRQYLSSIVFNNKEQLERLNSLVHPATIADAEQWFAQQHADYVIGITAPETLRMKRVMERDAITAAEVKRRMNNQIEDTIKMRLCDFIIYNNEQQLVTQQVIALHEQLVHLSANKPT